MTRAPMTCDNGCLDYFGAHAAITPIHAGWRCEGCKRVYLITVEEMASYEQPELQVVLVNNTETD